MPTYLALGPDRSQWWELPESWDYTRAHQQLMDAMKQTGSGTVPFDVVVEGERAVLLVKGTNLVAATVVTVDKDREGRRS